MRSVPYLVLSLAFGLGSAGAQEAKTHEPVSAVGRVHGGGYLGVSVLPLTPELREHFGAPRDAGVLVSRVEDDGPAASSGIRVGDVITAVDGERVEGPGGLLRLVRRKKKGEVVSVEIYRDGALESYPVTIAETERMVLDLAGRYRLLPELAGSRIELDEGVREALERARRELEEQFEDGAWQRRLQRLQNLDFGEIQRRMEEVERRLRELERELKEEREKP